MADSGGEEQAAKADSGTSTVFISYASEDAAVTNTLVAAVERQGLKCWIAPRDVVPGALYADEIIRAINEAGVVVVVLSKQAIASPHVGKEIERASSKGRRIIAFHTDAAPLTRALEYFLSESQWIDIGTGGTESAVTKLVEAVRRHLDSSSLSGSSVPSDPRLIRKSAGPRKIWMVAGAAVLFLALTTLVVDRFWLSKHAAEETPRAAVAPAAPVRVRATSVISEQSVAVLPFTDLSEKKDQEYFADGMAEEIVDILARIPQLKVIGRTSSFQFKGHAGELHAIGEKLGAAYVVEGSVRTGGSRIRVAAQLIDTRSGTQVWADSYDREPGDVLPVQGQIASAIARSLQLVVAAGDAQSLRQLQNPEAYTLYLRGRSAYDRGTEGLREAQSDFEQVLALEPTFSRAAEAVALTRLALIGSGVVTSQVGWPPAVQAAETTLRLDPKSAFAHLILGLKLATYDYDWAGATAQLEAALATKSRDPIVLYNSAWLAFDVGRYEEAVHLQDASLSLDPLNPDSLQNGAIIQYMLGHLDAAERAFRKGLEVSPTFDGNHRYLGRILLLRGQPKEALKEMETEKPGLRDVGLALVYHALGRRQASDAALARAKRGGGDSDEVSIAVAYAYRREPDQAFEWLEKAFASRDLSLVHTLAHEPLLASVREDARYSALLRKMKLPD